MLVLTSEDLRVYEENTLKLRASTYSFAEQRKRSGFFGWSIRGGVREEDGGALRGHKQVFPPFLFPAAAHREGDPLRTVTPGSSAFLPRGLLAHQEACHCASATREGQAPTSASSSSSSSA
uniref:Uncharacterized protein n=1 Tax=Chromera velia CCMP2878 TaxID=1169474 RepID=A0A0G4H951_9ALVE|eukprot:Cvel_25345.t1-p1 / transcript=Cvel_25345.t1 / gene=Cvel_25345 / organism=Chromera_velia_CCMP2878 / gene_product=hypothetical protein / transcript_product=hypothetical protein / location=Cvel_scaffold2858:18262-22540(+) / protein_length=120 / sequence_SO=supercontig / SO=protein_coding / is_pseudo=false